MVVDQENHVPATRSSSSSKKRTSLTNSFLLQPSSAKKRVVPGELTSSSTDTGSGHNPNCISKNERCRDRDKKSTRELKEKKKQEPGDVIEESFSDLRKCSFLSSIYGHVHFLEIEEKRRPLPDYIEKVQNDHITVDMREILMGWLVEVTEEYKLVSDTLYLTVSYIDRFLSAHSVSRNKLQLLGVSCMLIACKYEEITPPGIDDFCYITDNAYTKEEMVEMKKDVLKLLDFEVGTPTIRNFLRQECCPNVIKLVMRAAQGNCKVGTEHFSISRIAVGIFELLSCGAELAGLRIFTIPTVGSCFSSYFSVKIHNPTKRTPLEQATAMSLRISIQLTMADSFFNWLNDAIRNSSRVWRCCLHHRKCLNVILRMLLMNDGMLSWPTGRLELFKCWWISGDIVNCSLFFLA
ncbi:Cyclin-A3-2 [Hibiscus syriacus]|uniref:Cyclin-A3-2 n=1 Tax=Hibiscus syriacus TaxID=106335 RepID=A0A6A2XER8_HIBSY|nr:Cyclin-A3-2 [Hibiscus syriacus]